MAIVALERIIIIGLKSEMTKVTEILQRFGHLHPIPSEPKAASAIGATQEGGVGNEGITQVHHILTHMLHRQKAKHHFLDMPLEKVMEAQVDQEDIRLAYGNLKDRESRLLAIEKETTVLMGQMDLLRPWAGLDVSVESIQDTGSVHYVMGYLPKISFDETAEELQRIPGSLLLVVPSDHEVLTDKLVPVVVVCLQEDRESFDLMLQRWDFKAVELPLKKGLVQEALVRMEKDLSKLNEEHEGLMAEDMEYVVESALEELCVYFDRLSIEEQRRTVESGVGLTEDTFILSAWVPKTQLETLKALMAESGMALALRSVPPTDGEVEPTLLKNSPLAEPLEFITDQYSVPSSKGLDPNAVMMPFFVSFFGIMLSDAIYGLILTGIAYYLIRSRSPQGDFKKLLGILVMGGISASAWGVLFGGWFGGMIRIPALWFDPLTDPFKMIALCMAFGILHLFVGFGMQAAMNIKRGKVMDAVLDQGLWVLFIVSLLTLALPYLAPYNGYASMFFALMLIATQGRRKKNPLMKLAVGILSLYNITGFLGDVLSYMRLFALGMATGVIGQVINAMAFMLGGSLPGYLLMIVVLVIGHTFNIGINVLGAYVHSSRLQYVEFFSKFYEGDGVPFRAFTPKTTFVRLQPRLMDLKWQERIPNGRR